MNLRAWSLLLVASLALSSCRRNAASTPAAGGGPPGGFSIPVETTPAAVERVEDKVTAVGSLDADEMVQIKSEVEGRIREIAFQEGTQVKKGELLFQLDEAKAKAAVTAVEARLVKAQNNLDRSRKLLQQNTISPQEFDDVQAEFKDAQAMVVLAQERLADTTIRAPFDGWISERLVSPGTYVEKGETLVTVVASDPIKLDFSVPERFLSQVRSGQAVKVTVDSLAGQEHAGTVYFIDPKVDPSTRAVKLKARIPNAEGQLRPGLFANVELVVGSRDQAVVVPEQAVVPALDKVTLFVVENGLARRREVRLGSRLPGRVEIVEGVKAGEEVVVAGQQKLRDQLPVMTKPPATTPPAGPPSAVAD